MTVRYGKLRRPPSPAHCFFSYSGLRGQEYRLEDKRTMLEFPGLCLCRQSRGMARQKWSERVRSSCSLLDSLPPSVKRIVYFGDQSKHVFNYHLYHSCPSSILPLLLSQWKKALKPFPMTTLYHTIFGVVCQ